MRAFRRFALLQHVTHDTAGVAAVEFALLLPVLLLLMFGIIEFSLVMLVSNIMESATSLSSRLGKTGYTEAGISREDTILASIRQRAGTLIDAQKITIGVQYYSQFDQIGQAEPWNDLNHNGLAEADEYADINGNGQYDTDLGLAGYGNAGDIVVYTVSYPWSIQTPILRELLGHEGVYTVTTHTVVKNEPF